MSNKPNIPSFRFHIPHSGKSISYSELEKIVNRNRRVPEIVHVIDCDTHKALQAIPPQEALKKYG